MQRISLIVGLIAGSGCSLLFSSESTPDDGVADSGPSRDANPTEPVHDFESGQGPWVDVGGNCDLVLEDGDQAMCCEGGPSEMAAIRLDLEDEAPRIEVGFELKVKLPFVGNSTQFSPVAAVNNVPDLDNAPVANLNVYPGGDFTVKSVMGAGQAVEDRQSGLPVDVWADVSFVVDIDPRCGHVTASVTNNSDPVGTSTLALNVTPLSPSSSVFLGVFRQDSGLSSNRRCVDNVVITLSEGCQ